MYPTNREYVQVVKTLIVKYPFLKDLEGNGYHAWHMSLRRKFKLDRAPLVDNDEVRRSKEKFGHQTLKQPVETARNSQRNISKASGVLGGDPSSIEAHAKVLHSQYQKMQPDTKIIRDRMQQTFAWRQKEIADGMTVDDTVFLEDTNRGKAEDQRPVTVLRDTACSQSLILSSVLVLNKESACQASTVVRGTEMGFVPAPLHSDHVQSKLVTGFFPVAVRACFPIDGVDFIMGNDIAGGKMYPVAEVVDVPVSEPDHANLAKSHPNVFTACVLTRTQARKQAEDVTLSDSLFSSVLADDRLPPGGGSVSCAVKEPEAVPESGAAPAVSLSLTHARPTGKDE
ncbi:uncharacterized protein LOC125892873 [Epinephelus fuscoguttatus]|uniref:uncharacterized protein LOC125892873 n=1 Tax=Epinephelus fuscoguttatus TaxID=293821 RepID=UPI0020D0895B|nr:uncharacterized protein LOC125892873 [Epinephelus fuscoguttatus]